MQRLPRFLKSLVPGEKDGHIQIEVDGGKGPYEYKWSDPSIVGGNPSNIGAGKYEVTIVDDLGSSTIANLNFQDPDALKGNITVLSPATTGNEDAKAEVKVQEVQVNIIINGTMEKELRLLLN